jgi:hypothetical protein
MQRNAGRATGDWTHHQPKGVVMASVRSARFLILLLLVVNTAGAAVARIADGDCPALSAAAASSAGSEPSLIVLAARGHYGLCQLSVTGNIAIDGAGASLQLLPRVATTSSSQITVLAGASLTLRNLNVVGQTLSVGSTPAQASMQASAGATQTAVLFFQSPVIANSGTLLLDSVSISGIDFSVAVLATPLILNSGTLNLRNTTFVHNTGPNLALIGTSGEVEIAQSTFVGNNSGSASLLSVSGAGRFSVANSLFSANSSAACADTVSVVSLGGNISGEGSCGLAASGDKVVANAVLGNFGNNGGLVSTVVLNENSPAVRAGLAANCEASDARATVRNVQARGACDSGAFELGGGRGLLSQGGMSGFFFDASADGHYVTVQRLDWGSALVIWNTFDKNGQAAWIYSIGTVDGNHVHAQGAQNLGGVLQPGGPPTGSHGMAWGNIDIDLTDCFNATFRYDSPLPNFGSGQFPLNRLAFLGDLDCSS